MKLESGAWLTPTIQLLRLIDEGAMGSVWAADHLALGTEVAVKFVSEVHAKNRTIRRRLEAEARAASRIKSPHVVQIFDVAETVDEKPFIVMELLEGETLRTRLERGDLLSPTEAALLVMQACRALHTAHRLGIVHRDIKPENLFLLDDDDALFVKILDFGIAKGLTKGLTEPGVILGTPVYICRELITDRRSDHRGDLWSLSVVAYEALTGHLPFDGETLDEVFAAIWRGEFTPPSEICPTLTPAVDEFFAKALHKDRQERAASAKALAASFVQAIASDVAPASGEDWRISQLSLLAYRPSSAPPSTSDPAIAPPSFPPISSSPRPSDPAPASGPISSIPPRIHVEKVTGESAPPSDRLATTPSAVVNVEGPTSRTTPTPGIVDIPAPTRPRWLLPTALVVAAAAGVAYVGSDRPTPHRLEAAMGAAAAGLSAIAAPPPADVRAEPHEEAPAGTAEPSSEPPRVHPRPQPPAAKRPPAGKPVGKPVVEKPKAPPAPPEPKTPTKDLGF